MEKQKLKNLKELKISNAIANDEIIISDWTGVILFEGSYKDKEVDKVLDANRCVEKHNDNEVCCVCNDSGYSGDFEVYWKYRSHDMGENVYECINY